jgi:hypothetical protein
MQLFFPQTRQRTDARLTLEAKMVQIDHELIYEARKLITGANTHKLGQMILVYELAVHLHNRSRPSHEIYNQQYERDLRTFVAAARLATAPLARAVAAR